MTMLALLVAGILVMSPALATADVPDSEQVSKLLSEAKTQAFQLREDASTITVERQLAEPFRGGRPDQGTH
jgi:hypothetical protein